MKWSILPSESQVMSASTARRVGSSVSRWIGMIGKSWSMAQSRAATGTSRSCRSRCPRARARGPRAPRASRAARARCFRIFWQIAQKMFSATTRSVSDRWPSANSYRPLPCTPARRGRPRAGSCARRPGRSSNRFCTTRCASSGSLVRRLADVELADAQDVDHQHRVVRDHRAARLGDDGRVGTPAGVADLLHREDDVVGVLLQGVVHRRGEVGLRAVVVDAQAAADVEVLAAARPACSTST